MERPQVKKRVSPQLKLNSMSLEVNSDDMQIDEGTSEQAEEISFPSDKLFKEKPKAERR